MRSLGLWHWPGPQLSDLGPAGLAAAAGLGVAVAVVAHIGAHVAARDTRSTVLRPRSLVTAALLAAVAAAVVLARVDSILVAGALLVLVTAAIAIAICDSREHRIPTRFLQVTGAVMVPLLVAYNLDRDRAALVLVGGVVGAVVFVLGRRFRSTTQLNLGMGDVRLLALLAATLTMLSPKLAVVALALTFLLHAGTPVRVPPRRRWRLALDVAKPFGPPAAAALVLALAFGRYPA